MKKILVLFLLSLLGLGAASAQSTWVADKAHTDVLFTVTHMVISEVTGRFKDFDITVEQKNPADFVGASFVADIRTGSVDTENEGRDKHLRSDNFFNAEKARFIELLALAPRAVAITTTYYIRPNPIREIVEFVRDHTIQLPMECFGIL